MHCLLKKKSKENVFLSKLELGLEELDKNIVNQVTSNLGGDYQL